MFKRIVLGTLLVGLIGVLVAGAIIRTVDKTENVAEARGQGRGRGGGEETGYGTGELGQGFGANAQGNGRGGSGQGAGATGKRDRKNRPSMVGKIGQTLAPFPDDRSLANPAK